MKRSHRLLVCKFTVGVPTVLQYRYFGAEGSLSARLSKLKITQQTVAALSFRFHSRVRTCQAETRLEQITMDLGLPMLSDIKHQLNRMQEDAQKAVTAVADATKLDAEAIAEVIRAEIRLAMTAQGAGAGGASIRDMITAEIAYLQCGDRTEAGWSFFDVAITWVPTSSCLVTSA